MGHLATWPLKSSISRTKRLIIHFRATCSALVSYSTCYFSANHLFQEKSTVRYWVKIEHATLTSIHSNTVSCLKQVIILLLRSRLTTEIARERSAKENYCKLSIKTLVLLFWIHHLGKQEKFQRDHRRTNQWWITSSQKSYRKKENDAH